MSYYVSKNRCPQSHRCPMIRHCPVGAITQDGYTLPVIDKDKCIECGLCEQICNLNAVFKED